MGRCTTEDRPEKIKPGIRCHLQEGIERKDIRGYSVVMHSKRCGFCADLIRFGLTAGGPDGFLNTRLTKIRRLRGIHDDCESPGPMSNDRVLRLRTDLIGPKFEFSLTRHSRWR